MRLVLRVGDDGASIVVAAWVVMLILILSAMRGWAADPVPAVFTVENKLPPAFQVVNRMPAKPAPEVRPIPFPPDIDAPSAGAPYSQSPATSPTGSIRIPARSTGSRGGTRCVSG